MYLTIYRLVFILLFFILGGIYTTYAIKHHAEHEEASGILLKSLKANLSELSYAISKDISKKKGIDNYRSLFLRTVANSEYIESIIVTQKDEIIFSTETSKNEIPSDGVIEVLSDQDYFDQLQGAVAMKGEVRYFKDGKFYVNTIYFILNKAGVNKYIDTFGENYFLLLLLPIIIISGVFLVVFMLVVRPLRELHRFSHDELIVPKKFVVKEFEAIRSTMEQTFSRLIYKQRDLMKFETIVEQSPVSIIVTDIEGNIEYINPQFSKITGYSPQEVLGKTPHILASGDTTLDEYKAMWDNVSHHKAWSGVFRNIKKNGEAYWESAVIAPVVDLECNQIINYVGIKQDISENLAMKEMVQKQTRYLSENYEQTLDAMVEMIEGRDSYTAGHSQRVATYSRDIAKALGLEDEKCELLYRAGMLHDIGKVTTPDTILLKPGRLSQREYHLIQNHVSVSHQLLSHIPMYEKISEIVLNHHERYDGMGYPNGFKGDQIPLMSRIMIIADAFDAMTTNRIYKGRKSIEEAVAEIEALSGQQFDPEIVPSACEVLRKVNLESGISQLPKNSMEQERFSYFYRDNATDMYNKEYLEFFLQSENISEDWHVCVCFLRNFSQYNNRHGWEKGDDLLKEFAEFLQKTYSDAMIFRIHGDDFVLLNKDAIFKNCNTVISPSFLENTKVSVQCHQLSDKEDFMSQIIFLDKG